MQIDFYILEKNDKQKWWQFTCRLIEQLYQKQKKMYVHVASEEDANFLDLLLWTYHDIQFLPHQIYDKKNNQAPIQIGFDETTFADSHVLINLQSHIPPFYIHFNEIKEIVYAEPTVQQSARERYRLYRDKGHHINTIKITTPETFQI